MTIASHAALDAIEGLISAVCAAERADAFLAGRGTARPSARVPGGVRVELADGGPLAALEVRAWDGDAIGVVEVEIAPGCAPTWGEVQDRLGPFTPLALLHPGPAVMSATWWREPHPVDATVLVADPGGATAPVHALNIRRGRSRPG
ncbi:MAG: hypothetical protein AB1416_03840 [Actinomycetota bacterium]